jgi:hypothetical protein
MFSWSGGTPPYFAEVQAMYIYFSSTSTWLSEEMTMSLHPYGISSFAPTVCQSYLAQLQFFNTMTDTSIFRPQAIKGPSIVCPVPAADESIFPEFALSLFLVLDSALPQHNSGKSAVETLAVGDVAVYDDGQVYLGSRFTMFANSPVSLCLNNAT